MILGTFVGDWIVRRLQGVKYMLNKEFKFVSDMVLDLASLFI